MAKNKMLKAVNRRALLPVKKVEALKVEPGDVLLVRVDKSFMTPDIAKKATDLLKELYPDNFVLILSGEFSIDAVRLEEDGEGGYKMELK